MAICIICREEKSEFNEEHVIPQSLGGYYTIASVCKQCNSNLGSKVDAKLIDHWFATMNRHHLRLKGKSGVVPSPLSGVFSRKNDSESRYTFKFINGEYELYTVPNVVPLENGFVVHLDKSDEAKLDDIISKLAERNNVPKEALKVLDRKETTDQPLLEATVTLDIKAYKLGLLKIAYEFAVDKIEGYIDDPDSILIAEVLRMGSIEGLDKISMKGGIVKNILRPFDYLIEVENVAKHYMILISNDQIGMLCLVNLFDSFNVMVQLSSRNVMNGKMLVGVNDIGQRTFRVYDDQQIHAMSYGPAEIGFEYWFPTVAERDDFIAYQKAGGFDYYREEDDITLFNARGEIAYLRAIEKIMQPQLIVHRTDEEDAFLTEYEMDEDLFIQSLPGKRFHYISKIKVRNRQISRL